MSTVDAWERGRPGRPRFVAALPSFKADCSTGYMNVAVSTTTDPLGTWRRFRISMGDAWSEHIRIGVSDNKVVLATDRWDLDDGASDCLGAPYEGSRLRVADFQLSRVPIGRCRVQVGLPFKAA